MDFISDDHVEGVKISVRDAPPLHYTFKIQSFSSLLNNSIEIYDSSEFESGGYKWKLSLYPNGNKKVDAKDYISLYLAMADTSSLPSSWEVNVIFKFFLLDQIRNKYLTVEDIEGRFRRFHGGKTQLGFSQLIPHTTFNDPCNGYLVDDTCVFGVEVIVYKNTAKGECLSMIKEASTYKHTWKIEGVSKLTEVSYLSEAFGDTDHKWKIKFYPKDNPNKKSHSSLFLLMTESTTPNEKVYVKYSLCIRNQFTDKHIEEEDYDVFQELNQGWGWRKFIPINDLYDEGKGFLVQDTCVIYAEVIVLGLVTMFT